MPNTKEFTMDSGVEENDDGRGSYDFMGWATAVVSLTKEEAEKILAKIKGMKVTALDGTKLELDTASYSRKDSEIFIECEDCGDYRMSELQEAKDHLSEALEDILGEAIE
jgi:hypothetical protein